MRMMTMTISGSLPPKETGGLNGRTGLLEATGRKADGHGCTLRLLRALLTQTEDDGRRCLHSTASGGKKARQLRVRGAWFFCSQSCVDTVSSQRV